MKYLIFTSIAVILAFSACKKDNLAYSCKCADPSRLLVDTFINFRVETSGEAFYECKNFQDTANKYGRPYVCDLTN